MKILALGQLTPFFFFKSQKNQTLMPIAQLFPSLFCLKLRREQTAVVNILKSRML